MLEMSPIAVEGSPKCCWRGSYPAQLRFESAKIFVSAQFSGAASNKGAAPHRRRERVVPAMRLSSAGSSRAKSTIARNAADRGAGVSGGLTRDVCPARQRDKRCVAHQAAADNADFCASSMFALDRNFGTAIIGSGR